MNVVSTSRFEIGFWQLIYGDFENFVRRGDLYKPFTDHVANVRFL